jgi:hypothetical protein
MKFLAGKLIAEVLGARNRLRAPRYLTFFGYDRHLPFLLFCSLWGCRELENFALDFHLYRRAVIYQALPVWYGIAWHPSGSFGALLDRLLPYLGSESLNFCREFIDLNLHETRRSAAPRMNAVTPFIR